MELSNLKWKSSVLKKENSIKDAINVLENEGHRIVLIADNKFKLLGTVTDGDIRRALINDFNMETNLSEIMTKNPIAISSEEKNENVLKKMTSNGILQIPIIDDQEIIVGLETIQHLLEVKKKDNIVLLMAGGFGKRLRPLTDNKPKPLLEVAGQPVLETIINQFKETGFNNFFISTFYKSEMIQKHFGDGSKLGINITYTEENKPLGTAGALAHLPYKKTNHPIIVMNADLITKINIERILEFHKKNNADMTVCVRNYDFQIPYGVINFEKEMLHSIKEKPIISNFVNAGIYVIEPKSINKIKKDEHLNMNEFIENLISENKKITVFPIHEYWMDIGQLDEYEKVNNDFEK